MKSQTIFIIILIIFLVAIKSCKCNSNSNKNIDNFNNSDMGIYNHFYKMSMNPYTQSITPFFSNDKLLNKD
jgi:hypothetical protein